MKKVMMLSIALVIFSASGYFPGSTKKESFSEKEAHYNAFKETESYLVLLRAIETETATEAQKQELLEYFKVFEGSSIEELSTIFEVEVSADASCYWVTTSTYCEYCRHSAFKCGLLTAYKPCVRVQNDCAFKSTYTINLIKARFKLFLHFNFRVYDFFTGLQLRGFARSFGCGRFRLFPV